VSLPLRIGWWLLGVGYVFAGLMHFARLEAYLPMMPPSFPAHRALVELSGAAEVSLGLGALVLGGRVPALRRWIAWGVIALLVAVFPANLHVAAANVPLFGAQEGAGPLNYVRLPFQAVLIGWAWIYTRKRNDGPAAA
jgi:uncharacterized membrane protein